MQTTAKIYLNDKTWARWTALILVASMMFFAYMFVDVISPYRPLSRISWAGHPKPTAITQWFGIPA